MILTGMTKNNFKQNQKYKKCDSEDETTMQLFNCNKYETDLI